MLKAAFAASALRNFQAGVATRPRRLLDAHVRDRLAGACARPSLRPGSPLVAAAVAAGRAIDLVLSVRGDRGLERKWHNRHGTRNCPRCKSQRPARPRQLRLQIRRSQPAPNLGGGRSPLWRNLRTYDACSVPFIWEGLATDSVILIRMQVVDATRGIRGCCRTKILRIVGDAASSPTSRPSRTRFR